MNTEGQPFDSRDLETGENITDIEKEYAARLASKDKVESKAVSFFSGEHLVKASFPRVDDQEYVPNMHVEIPGEGSMSAELIEHIRRVQDVAARKQEGQKIELDPEAGIVIADKHAPQHRVTLAPEAAIPILEITQSEIPVVEDTGEFIERLKEVKDSNQDTLLEEGTVYNFPPQENGGIDYHSSRESA